MCGWLVYTPTVSFFFLSSFPIISLSILTKLRPLNIKIINIFIFKSIIHIIIIIIIINISSFLQNIDNYFHMLFTIMLITIMIETIIIFITIIIMITIKILVNNDLRWPVVRDDAVGVYCCEKWVYWVPDKATRRSYQTRTRIFYSLFKELLPFLQNVFV